MNSSRVDTRQATLLYDGQCPFCIRSVKLAKRLDWFNRLRPADARTVRDASIPISPERLMEEMHLITPGTVKIYHGFGAFRWMAWRLPLLWVLVPFLYLPGIPTLGQKIYLWIARNRFQLVPCHGGVCQTRLPAQGADEESPKS
jgi:predicted DCC family thiol-disulfide oxidoreductase YuxK